MASISPPNSRVSAWLPLVVAATIVLSAGCRSADRSKFPPSWVAPGEPTHAVYVTTNHWHAGIILADDDLPPRLDAALQPWRDELSNRNQTPAAFHEFGWGDDAYYKAPAGTKTSGMTLSAMLWPTRSINHVWGLDQSPSQFFADYDVAIFRVDLSTAGRDALADFLLTRLTEPVAVELPGVYGDRSAFLTANPRRQYHALHNCNHMVADALAAAGLPISPIYAVHSVNIEYQLDRIARNYGEVTRLQSRLENPESIND